MQALYTRPAGPRRVKMRRCNTQRSLQYESHPPEPPSLQLPTLCRMTDGHTRKTLRASLRGRFCASCLALSLAVEALLALPRQRLRACLDPAELSMAVESSYAKHCGGSVFSAVSRQRPSRQEPCEREERRRQASRCEPRVLVLPL
ncbi:hypothetical protein CCMA1212_002255 [Trichoderma ghanense]|uniref:Uncharacterized protein n=1 Tax=Trichoderma ghanense TaxID=65468 RepID=A0ABY2HEE9_9HYPO